MNPNQLLSRLVTLLIVAICANGLDLESANEQPCFNITKTAPLDLNWVGTLKTLYYPLMSRLDLFSSAINLIQKDPKDISEASVYYDLCVYWNLYSNGSIIARGYNGKSREYQTKLINGMEKFEFTPVEGMGYSGTKYTTLTDNKSFFFTPFCMDGQMTWGIGTTTPTVTEETKKMVYDHAESLGFKREYFTELRYDRCDIEMIDYGTSDADNGIESTTTANSGD